MDETRAHACTTRRRFAAVAAAAAAAVAAPALRAQGKPEKTRVTIAVGGKAAFRCLPLTISEQLGYFQAEGLDVEVIDVPAGAAPVQAIAAGAADVVSGAYEHTIQLQSRNQFFQAFVLQGRAPQVAVGVSTRTFPSLRSAADLRGRRIGVSAPGSSANMVAHAVLARAGVKAGEVSYVGVGTSADALAALRSGQIDAMSNTDPVMTMLEHRGEVRIIGDTRTLKGTREVFGGPMPAGCLYAPQEFVQKNPNTCQALANAIVRALKWLQTAGPSDIIKTVPEAYLLGDRALYLAAFDKVREAISPDGVLADDGARTAVKALASFEPTVKADKIELARTYTNDFARRAKDKFKA
ncbi:ABC transporter substrate-binding protein [Ramlibacter tataouinensis]|uniref:Candidate ABC type nitrate/sulfonate/bicarbonate transport system, periplasmic component n=1 Tax=Ramlibacter tataouinensis (strain ATCC BAA-407 / DSM 14655 / LMG 21543 / TTB310) TaxID=365046 RepID=F5Y0L8_RAMTT|nr:ABC transporter substrate-binding protein [Ramlibacter tataouinensis]AEG93424.1 candidate ABC type nitrate/sulfonate/bicarbonate transport system, periplasmic component [Ramlibacter tataouinensis TTB310]